MATKYNYQTEIAHPGLNKSKTIKALTQQELQVKVNAQMAQWNDQWAKIQNEEEALRYADNSTKKAVDIQLALDKMVLNRAKRKQLDLNRYKDYSVFPEPRPLLPSFTDIPREPLLSDDKYNPNPSFFTKISRKKRMAFLDQNVSVYTNDHSEWEQKRKAIIAANDNAEKEYNEKSLDWERKQLEFIETQTRNNEKVDAFFSSFQKGDIHSVERYFVLLLGNLEFPFNYSISASAEYLREEKRLIVEIFLPSVEDIPRLKSVNYIKARKEFKETYYSDTYLNKKYDSIIYQIVLICLDAIIYIGKLYDLVDYVVINGRIKTIDKATGNNIQPCILTLATDKESFSEINVDAVDPKTWFKSTKGIAAASIANVTPVKPILQMSYDDSRFIEGYHVADSLDESVNLASIDWQDFEHLIRELFEKEFSTNGGKVKITQASRDGGVDAIAFDPDPIRGGKIVIQAKRYTNVVGVSAVRDLYGTVMNEGANKGILVTTSNYGNDAYNFANGKPLTLINGGGLLYLMEKHGYKARIDLKEAKEMQHKM